MQQLLKELETSLPNTRGDDIVSAAAIISVVLLFFKK